MSYESILATLSVTGEILVLVMLLRSKVWRNLPLFCIYTAWTLIGDLALITLQRQMPSNTFFRWYIAETAVDSIFLFTVLVELAWSVLRPIRASLPRISLYILGGLIALAAVAVWPLVAKTSQPGFGPDSMLLFHLQETAAILRVGCFLVLASFSQLLSIGWRDRELQIATGFGFYSIITLIVAVLHSRVMPADQYHWLDMAVSVGYVGTLSYWVVSFSTKEQERKDFSPQMRELLLSMSGGARVSRSALSDLPSDRLRKKDK